MTVKPHPSLLLILDIDEEFDTKEQRLEIDRCYSYLCTPVVRTHARTTEAPCNTVRLVVRLGTKRYWQTGPQTDALWHDVIESWLYNQLYKLDNHMKIYNRRQREEGAPELVFTWLEVDLENGAFTVRFRLDSTSGIPAKESTWVTTVRDAVNSGELGGGATEVTLPSEASYVEQRRAGLVAKAERERAAAEEEARLHAERLAEAQQREVEADELFLESPALAARAGQGDGNDSDEEGMLLQFSGAAMGADDNYGKSDDTQSSDSDESKTAEEIIAERIAEEEHLAEELERKYALPDPDFAIDYGTWTVHYADGSRRDYNPASKAFVGQAAARQVDAKQATSEPSAADPAAAESPAAEQASC